MHRRMLTMTPKAFSNERESTHFEKRGLTKVGAKGKLY